MTLKITKMQQQTIGTLKKYKMKLVQLEISRLCLN